MSDEADIAVEREQALLDAGIAMVRQAAKPLAQVWLHCSLCDDEIPPDRRAAVPGCCLCVPCQEKMEGGMGR